MFLQQNLLFDQCQWDDCGSSQIQCPMNADCMVFCNGTHGSCSYGTIYCPTFGNCLVNCNGEYNYRIK